MGSIAKRITIAASIAGLISAASPTAMAQTVSDDAAFQSSPFINSTDYRPDWPVFEPLSAPQPTPPGAANLIEILNPPPEKNPPNVLILPQVMERSPGGAA
jgi:hypothetical protein